MSLGKYDLVVAYRIYPLVSKTPFVHKTDKYKLSEVCLCSFKKALGPLKVKMFAILDNCPYEYNELFHKYFSEDDLEIVRVNGVGNKETFKKQIELLLSQNQSETIYFAEDDYLYLPNSIVHMVDYLNNVENVDFISVYDHLDLYTYELHKHNNYLQLFGDHHWRTANSTCLTFITKKKILEQTKKVFLSYSTGNLDASLWISLTKHKLNVVKCLFYYFTDIEMFRIIAKAWYYCWPYILFGKRRKLWIPIPALGTHVEKKYLAPTINWKKYISG
ncbi:glycosyltransferase family 2 protein [candidate division TA06 bacterium]|nr:glycosyltransferase family 2 protein [candidate division TA06 bacterium]